MWNQLLTNNTGFQKNCSSLTGLKSKRWASLKSMILPPRPVSELVFVYVNSHLVQDTYIYIFIGGEN